MGSPVSARQGRLTFQPRGNKIMPKIMLVLEAAKNKKKTGERGEKKQTKKSLIHPKKYVTKTKTKIKFLVKINTASGEKFHLPPNPFLPNPLSQL